MVNAIYEVMDRQHRNLVKRVEATSTTQQRRRRRRRPLPQRRTIIDRPFLTALIVAVLFFGFITIITYQVISTTSSSGGGDHRIASELTHKPHGGTTLAAFVRDGIRARNPSSRIERLQHTFPLHVAEETMEIIDHPAVPYLLTDFPPHHDDYYDEEETVESPLDQTKRIRQVNDVTDLLPPGAVATMKVPVMFDQAYGHIYGSERIRNYLGDGQRLLTLAEAKSIGSFDQKGHETIYVSIASYRDWECPITVANLYERAEFPERIRVAIIEQRLPDDEMICNRPEVVCAATPEQPLCKYAHLIDYFEMDAVLGVGPVFARHIAHRYYRGEYFAMQVDAHVRFVQNWDSILVDQWKSADNEMAVLTTYMSDLTNSIDPATHESVRSELGRPIMCDSIFEDHGSWRHMRHDQEPEGRAVVTGEPMLHPFWAAGFSFARGHFVIQVPYDQYLPTIFQGEEISVSVRGFTYGYDYYAPEKSTAFHIYKTKSNDRGKIHKFDENKKYFRKCELPAMLRLNNLIQMTNWSVEEWVDTDKELYGVGNVRTAKKYYATFGIHVDKMRTERHLCDFVTKKMHAQFKPFLRSNGMGLDYDKMEFEYKDPWPDDPDDDHSSVV